MNKNQIIRNTSGSEYIEQEPVKQMQNSDNDPKVNDTTELLRAKKGGELMTVLDHTRFTENDEGVEIPLYNSDKGIRVEKVYDNGEHILSTALDNRLIADLGLPQSAKNYDFIMSRRPDGYYGYDLLNGEQLILYPSWPREFSILGYSEQILGDYSRYKKSKSENRATPEDEGMYVFPLRGDIEVKIVKVLEGGERIEIEPIGAELIQKLAENHEIGENITMKMSNTPGVYEYVLAPEKKKESKKKKRKFFHRRENEAKILPDLYSTRTLIIDFRGKSPLVYITF